MDNNKSRNKTKLKILYMLFGLCVSAMLVFGGMLFWEMYTVRQGQAFYNSLSVEFMPRLQSTRVINTEAEGVFVPFINFDEKREVFPNIVGWIQSEGTVINYPIVQATDNDFYLYRLPDGSRHAMGSIFLDYRNMADFTDLNIVIYGHDMRSGDKFGTLRHYREQEYFEQHPSMFIFTPEHNYELLLFAGYVLDSTLEVPPMWFEDEEDFNNFITNIQRRSFFRSDIEVKFEDQLVFLATCTPTGSVDERLIIVGIIIEI